MRIGDADVESVADADAADAGDALDVTMLTGRTCGRALHNSRPKGCARGVAFAERPAAWG